MGRRTVIEAVERRLLLSGVVTAATPGGTLGSRVAVDAAGDVFGTTLSTATSAGTVFEVPAGTGVARTVASFGSPGADNTLGIDPGDILIDAGGNLFGDTTSGGAITGFYNDVGGGTLWELPAGAAAVRVLYTFGGGGSSADAGSGLLGGPYSVAMDAAGDLFAAVGSGINFADIGEGPEVVEYVAATGALRTVQQPTRSFSPRVTADAAGNAYVAIPSFDGGSVYRYGVDGGQTVLTSDEFSSAAAVAVTPGGDVVVAADGIGTGDYGPAVVEVLPGGTTAAGPVPPRLLGRPGGGTDGATSVGAPVVDSAGDVFVVAAGYAATGSAATAGTLLELSPGQAVPRVLARFDSRAAYETAGGLTLDAGGDLYWATDQGVYELPATDAVPPGPASSVTPAVVGSTLSTKAVIGKVVRGVVRVTVTVGAGAVAGVTTVDVVDTASDGTATVLGRARRRLPTTAGRSATVAVRLRPTRIAAAPYALTVDAVDPAGGRAATAGPPLDVVQPTVYLSATATANGPARPGRPVSVTLVITNGGNVPGNGPTTISLHLEPDADYQKFHGFFDNYPLVATRTLRLRLAANGGRTRARLRFRLPRTQLPGDYDLGGEITQDGATSPPLFTPLTVTS